MEEAFIVCAGKEFQLSIDRYLNDDSAWTLSNIISKPRNDRKFESFLTIWLSWTVTSNSKVSNYSISQRLEAKTCKIGLETVSQLRHVSRPHITAYPAQYISTSIHARLLTLRAYRFHYRPWWYRLQLRWSNSCMENPPTVTIVFFMPPHVSQWIACPP